eukprot:1935653-Pleurochrysis_carterae.AAC.2
MLAQLQRPRSRLGAPARCLRLLAVEALFGAAQRTVGSTSDRLRLLAWAQLTEPGVKSARRSLKHEC